MIGYCWLKMENNCLETADWSADRTSAGIDALQLPSPNGTRIGKIPNALRRIAWLLLLSAMALGLQATNVDSLRRVVHALPKDTASVIQIVKITGQLRGEGSPEAEEFGKMAIDMAKGLAYPKYAGEANMALGLVYSYHNNYEAALRCFNTAENHFREANSEPGIAKTNLNMGALYLGRKNYDVAQQHLLVAKEIVDRLGITRYKCSVNANLAIILAANKRYPAALSLYMENLKILENQEDSLQLANTYCNIGFVYDEQQRYDEGLKYFQKAYEIAIAAEGGLYYEGGYALQNMISSLIKLGRLPAAEKQLATLWPIARRSGSAQLIADTYHASADLHAGIGDYQQAYRDFEAYVQLKDSLVNEDQNAKLAAMQTEYEILKRDATIASIEQESIIIKATQQRQAADASRQSFLIIILAILGGSLLIAFAIMVFIMVSRNRVLGALKSSHRLIEDQHREIELQNNALKLQNERLEDLNREKDGLVGIVAHDLKSPMNKALALSELLQIQGPLNEDQLRSVSMMGKVASAGNDLIRDLLDLNAIEHPDTDLRPEHVDLAALLHELEVGYEGEARRKDLRMHFQIAADLPSLRCDRKSLVRVMDNLISNAMKFSPRGLAIHVKAYAGQNGELSLEVADEGPGISPSDQEKMFKKFQRLTARPTGGENSTGLGLAITQALVHKLGGEIDLHSKLGAGARFVVKLPAGPQG